MRRLNVLRRPTITEKSMIKTSSGSYTFEVEHHTSKGQIKRAVEAAFGVTVIAVNTAKASGKTHRVGKFRHTVRTHDRKKAVIKLMEGQKIEVFETKS